MPTVPEELRLAKGGATLTVTFAGTAYPLAAEYLRVCSPSAEEPVGGYAVRLYFSDGHHTGIYTWETLHDLALNADDYWQRYLQALAAEGKTRDEK